VPPSDVGRCRCSRSKEPLRRRAARRNFEARSCDSVERALTTLPPHPRRVRLERREGLSYAEVASRMAISPKTIGVHISRALTSCEKRWLPS